VSAADPVCLWCGELVGEDEQEGHFSSPMHRECATRAVVGSVGHLRERCTCFVDADQAEHDPPGMTRREAARAAFELFHETRPDPEWPSCSKPDVLEVMKAKLP
jgi:broad specificity phosphatase PhoE